MGLREWRKSINTDWRCQNCQAEGKGNRSICYNCYTKRPHADGFESDHNRKKRFKKTLPPRNSWELFALQKSEEYRRESRHNNFMPDCRKERSALWKSKSEIRKTIKNNGPRPLWNMEEKQPQSPSNDGREPQVTIKISGRITILS